MVVSLWRMTTPLHIAASWSIVRTYPERKFMSINEYNPAFPINEAPIPDAWQGSIDISYADNHIKELAYTGLRLLTYAAQPPHTDKPYPRLGELSPLTYDLGLMANTVNPAFKGVIDSPTEPISHRNQIWMDLGIGAMLAGRSLSVLATAPDSEVTTHTFDSPFTVVQAPIHDPAARQRIAASISPYAKPITDIQANWNARTQHGSSSRMFVGFTLTDTDEHSWQGSYDIANTSEGQTYLATTAREPGSTRKYTDRPDLLLRIARGISAAAEIMR
jgi:hypothetical protein